MNKKYYSAQKTSLSQKEKKVLHRILERQVKRYQFAISKSSNNPDKIKNIKSYISTIFEIVKKLNLPRINITKSFNKKTNVNVKKEDEQQINTEAN